MWRGTCVLAAGNLYPNDVCALHIYTHTTYDFCMDNCGWRIWYLSQFWLKNMKSGSIVWAIFFHFVFFIFSFDFQVCPWNRGAQKIYAGYFWTIILKAVFLIGVLASQNSVSFCGPLNDHSSKPCEALTLRIGPNWSLQLAWTFEKSPDAWK